MSSLSTPIVLHLFAAGTALLIGPIALTARKGSRLHRAAGWSWVALMLTAAISAVFIRDYRLPNLAGFTWIHLFVPITLVGLASAIWRITRRDIRGHQMSMWGTYLGGCVAAGLAALAPGRFLGEMVWRAAPGWM